MDVPTQAEKAFPDRHLAKIYVLRKYKASRKKKI